MKKPLLLTAFLTMLFNGANATIYNPPGSGNFQGVLPSSKGGTGATSLGLGLSNNGGVLDTAVPTPLLNPVGVVDSSYAGRLVLYKNANTTFTTLLSATSPDLGAYQYK